MRVTKIAFAGIIEHVSDLIFTIAQIIYTLWPLIIIVVALGYSFQGRMTWKALILRVRQSLLFTWAVLFFVWLFTLFAPLPTPGLLPEPWNTLAFLTGFALLLLREASRLGLLRRRLRARVELRHNHSLQRLKTMEPYDFEYLVAETYRSLGYKALQVGRSGDHGVDVRLLAPDGKQWVVQCKRYGSTVGESVIRELYGTMVSEKAGRAVLITTAQVTTPARDWARGKPIDLVDGPDFLKMMDEAQRRAEGSFLTRLSVWFERFLEAGRPPGLRSLEPAGQDPSIDGSATQPTRVMQTNVSSPADSPPPARSTPLTYTSDGAPICPNCGLVMIPRTSQGSNHSSRLLYRCRNYPDCRIVLEPQWQK